MTQNPDDSSEIIDHLMLSKKHTTFACPCCMKTRTQMLRDSSVQSRCNLQSAYEYSLGWLDDEYTRIRKNRLDSNTIPAAKVGRKHVDHVRMSLGVQDMSARCPAERFRVTVC